MQKRKQKLLQELTGTKARELAGIISSTGTLPTDELLDLLNAKQPVCAIYVKPCSKNKNTNPNCFCNLVPAPGAHRKKGLWQKDSAALLSLGPDPSTNKREVGFQHEINPQLACCCPLVLPR